MPNRTWIISCLALVISFSSSMSGFGQDKPKRANAKAATREALPEPDSKVVYKQQGDRQLELHVFDAKTKSPEPHAAVVFFFGGGWTGGSPEQFYSQSRLLADRGMTAICADYRVRSRDNSKIVDSVVDAQDAMIYVFEHAKEWNVDTKRIAAGGGSAGGHLAAAVALLAYQGDTTRAGKLEQSRPTALVLFNPAVMLMPSEVMKLDSQSAAKLEELKERAGTSLDTLSPYHHLTTKLPSTLILHGKADTTVPYATVDAFEKKANELGASCTLIGYEGKAHGFFNKNRADNSYDETVAEMVKFFENNHFLKKD